jgi:signal transduction histidine kinase
MTTYSEAAPVWLRDLTRDEVVRAVEALHQAHRLVAVITDLDALLHRIMDESKRVACAEACSLLLYDEEKGELYFHVALGESGEQQALLRRVRLKLGQGIAGTAAADRVSINVPDVTQDSRFFSDADAATQFRTRNLLAVPLVDRERLIGVLEVVNKVGAPHFSAGDLYIMEMFAALAASAIVNARLIEENIRRERMAAIGMAMTGLSHYAKNIITGMSGGGELIEQALRTDNIEMIKRTWPVFNRSSKRIAHFVQDMLTYSKPRQPMRETAHLDKIIADAHQTFAELFVRKQVHVQVDLAGVENTVHVDPQGIYRCLVNLFTNAADAVPSDQGNILVSAKTLPDGSAHICLQDNGPGVPEENVDMIFEPFYSTKGSHGTGLGLAVTRKIIQEHGGNVRVERGDLGGAKFCIFIPGAGAAKKGEFS